jgi:hypothetical protein
VLTHTPSNATDARGCQYAADDDMPVETSTGVANALPPPAMTPPRTTPPTPSPRRLWRRWREKEQVQNLCYGMSNLQGTYLQRELERGVR